MSIRTLLTLHGFIYAAFALSLFFIPDTLWPVYGLSVNDEYSRFLSQHNSIFLGGIAAIALLLRSIEPNSDSARKLVFGMLATNILGVVITLYACLIGVFSGFGWSDPMFFSLMALLCVWCLRVSR